MQVSKRRAAERAHASEREPAARCTPRGRGGTAVSAANIVGLILAVALTVFVVAALLFPERF